MAIKIMPCGYKRTGKLKEHLAHYRACEDEACKERVKAWEELKEAFKKGQTPTGEIRSDVQE